MPTYLKSQVQQKKLPVELANNTLAALASSDQQRALPRADR
jgi:hypothetical protein